MEPKAPKENLNELYVDHLVAGLEKRPLAKILDFMALYCGWEEIFTYVYKKVEERRQNHAYSVGDSDENKTALGMNVIVSDVLEAGQVMMVSQSGIDKAVEKLDLRTVPVNLKYPQSAYHILEALVFGVGADNVKSALKEITQRDE